MVHLGDITKMSGYTIPPVDVVTFGSPCQDPFHRREKGRYGRRTLWAVL